VVPKEFGKRFLERLSQGKLDRERALELCKANDSPLARVYGHVIRYWGQPAATIRQAADHDMAAELMALRRNVRVLNGTATIAPLLGLLGTVVGMIESFDAVGGGRVGNATRSEALAHGIGLALVATALGLAIAIVSVAFYYYFLQRVDALTQELDEQARQVIDLVSAEALRGHSPAPRAGLVSGGDYPGPEPSRPARTLGRVDTV
jgi:biopolymer transport protein ExbB